MSRIETELDLKAAQKHLSTAGFLDPLWRADPNCASLQGLDAAVRQGLQRQCRALLFEDVPPEFICAEAFDVEADGGDRREARGHSRLLVSSSSDEYSAAGLLTSLLSRTTTLLPTVTNRVAVRSTGEGWLELEIRLAQPLTEPLEESEIDLYCAAAGDGMKAVEALDAFRVLAAAGWPAGARPRLGSRPIWPRQGVGLSLSRLLGSQEHPFEERFLRLPLAPLLDRLSALQPESAPAIRIPVRVGRRYEEGLARSLEGRLHLNHGVFWNRLVYDVAGPAIRADARDGSRLRISLGRPVDGTPLLLECVDRASGATFFDARWHDPGIDPLRLVTVQPSQAPPSSQVTLDFHLGTAPSPRELHCTLLVPVDWSRAPGPRTGQWIKLDGNECFLVRAAARTSGDLDPVVSSWGLFGSQGLLWRIQTRRDLIEALWHFMPRPLQRAVQPGRVRVTPVFKPAQGFPVPGGLQRHAVPVTCLELRCRPEEDPAEIEPYLETLEARLQERCTPDILVQLHVNQEEQHDAQDRD